MADFSLPALGDSYANFLQYLKDRDSDIAEWFDATGSSNLTIGFKGWDSTNKKFVKWSGSAWVDLETTYNINVASVGTFTPGNASGNLPVSNGTVNTNLNADMVDGAHAGTAANNVLKLDANGRALTANLPLSGAAAGTYRSVTVNLQGQVTGGTNPTTKAGYGITDVPSNDGTGATGTWPVSITGNAATASATSGNAATATIWQNTRTLTLARGLRGSVSFNGSADFTIQAQLAFGADNTAGTADWNAAGNLAAGFNSSLLMGNAANGPGLAGWHYVMNMEYQSRDGTGSICQMALPYHLDGNSDLWIRTRQTGVWTQWFRLMTNQNVGAYSAGRTGAGASGTWNIDITGTAANAAACSGNAASASVASSLSANATATGIVNNGSYRLTGNNVLSWDQWGGAISMTDANWIRFSKNGYFGTNVLRTDGDIHVGDNGAAFRVTSGGTVTAAQTIKAAAQLFGNNGSKGYGNITTTTSTTSPTGGASGDFYMIY